MEGKSNGKNMEVEGEEDIDMDQEEMLLALENEMQE
jgi:hypothetical protein